MLINAGWPLATIRFNFNGRHDNQSGNIASMILSTAWSSSGEPGWVASRWAKSSARLNSRSRTGAVSVGVAWIVADIFFLILYLRSFPIKRLRGDSYFLKEATVFIASIAILIARDASTPAARRGTSTRWGILASPLSSRSVTKLSEPEVASFGCPS
jgi:hypothetical protein